MSLGYLCVVWEDHYYYLHLLNWNMKGKIKIMSVKIRGDHDHLLRLLFTSSLSLGSVISNVSFLSAYTSWLFQC